MPIAYFPSFYLVNHSVDISAFIADFLNHQKWPVGPPWFILVLLLFNLVVVLIPVRFYNYISELISSLTHKPVLFLLVIFAVVSLAYIPISLWVGQYTWTGFGPFDFQLNRLLLYFSFFLFGTCLGSSHWEIYLFTERRLLAKSWLFWVTLCLLCYILIELFTYKVWYIVQRGQLAVNLAWLLFSFFFVASCIASSFAFLAIFKRYVKKEKSLWANLSANAFGIYLIHYVFITWIQFALLTVSLPVFIKFLIVFLGAFLASWVLINFARRLSFVNRIL